MAINRNRFLLFKEILFVFLVITCLSCENEIDNYDSPNGGIHGTLYDKNTKEPIPLPVVGGSGAMVSLFEKNTNASESIDFRASQDGTFTNIRVFNGDYRVVVDGPFVGVVEGEVRIQGQTEFELYAIPLSRIVVDAGVSEDNKLIVQYQIIKADEILDLTTVKVIWNFSPEVDVNTSNYAGIADMGSKERGNYVYDLLSDREFIENHYKVQSNDNKIYARVAATVENVVNYSKVIELTLN